jgi:hypothetical protein
MRIGETVWVVSREKLRLGTLSPKMLWRERYLKGVAL